MPAVPRAKVARPVLEFSDVVRHPDNGPSCLEDVVQERRGKVPAEERSEVDRRRVPLELAVSVGGRRLGLPAAEVPGHVRGKCRVHAAQPGPLPGVVVEDQRSHVRRPLGRQRRRSGDARLRWQPTELERPEVGRGFRHQLPAHREEDEGHDRRDHDDRDPPSSGYGPAEPPTPDGWGGSVHAARRSPERSASLRTIRRPACPSPKGFSGWAMRA